ncbi:DUF1120 domain-containing protein [Cronobacter sakazakii]|uniref:DUF1120 domain-containing protein n=1 Tax=Cronobacter sakazakii TaxID=28141 RepID=UPI000CFB8AAD|nr:DUF1120 domain-containing protein [Cronobacter sakazakii]EIZ9495641.1 DUF1120 domain-containing protein [Cronobacter sakazakii]PQY18458.1 fimbrial assembly protein [Cronobacter sakazakii]
MKKLILASALMMAFGMNAYASDSVDLKVTGTLSMTSCTPAFGNGGVIDLGHIPIKNMKLTSNGLAYEDSADEHTKIDLTITCPTAMIVGFTMTDNKEGTVPESMNSYQGAYGFGTTSDGKKIGLYQLYKNAVTLDGADASLLYSLNNGQSWNGAYALNHKDILFAFSKKDETTPASGKSFDLKIDVTHYFEKSVVESVTDQLDFQGSTTFSLFYM